MVVGGVEFAPIVIAAVDAEPASVVNLVHLVRLGHCALTDFDLLVLQ
jgi:hypothetical protein